MNSRADNLLGMIKNHPDIVDEVHNSDQRDEILNIFLEYQSKNKKIVLETVL